MNPHPISLDYETYLRSLVVNPDHEVSLIYMLDGAGLYKITDEHYVCVICTEHTHKGKALLERVMPRDWECFSAAVNPEDGFELYHYGPPA